MIVWMTHYDYMMLPYPSESIIIFDGDVFMPEDSVLQNLGYCIVASVTGNYIKYIPHKVGFID